MFLTPPHPGKIGPTYNPTISFNPKLHIIRKYPLLMPTKPQQCNKAPVNPKLPRVILGHIILHWSRSNPIELHFMALSNMTQRNHFIIDAFRRQSLGLNSAHLNFKFGRKFWRMADKQPSAATSKSTSISTISPVSATLHFTPTVDLSLEVWKEMNWWPHNISLGGNPLYNMEWRSAQCAARKLKFSSLVNVLLVLFPLSVALFWWIQRISTYTSQPNGKK